MMVSRIVMRQLWPCSINRWYGYPGELSLSSVPGINQQGGLCRDANESETESESRIPTVQCRQVSPSLGSLSRTGCYQSSALLSTAHAFIGRLYLYRMAWLHRFTKSKQTFQEPHLLPRKPLVKVPIVGNTVQLYCSNIWTYIGSDNSNNVSNIH